MNTPCIGNITIGRLGLWLYNYRQCSMSKNNYSINIDFAWFGISWRVGSA